MINMVDVFVFFEDVDFTKRDWRTRNKIKSKDGDLLLSVPVKKASRGTKIFEIEIHNDGWQKKHFSSLSMNYKKSPYYKDYLWLLEDIYLKQEWKSLSKMNQYITKAISEVLGIDTQFVNSITLDSSGTGDDKLIDICKKLGATSYLSGPAAKDYIDINKFKRNSIGLEYMVYDYSQYPQLFGEFDHFVSVLDVLFNCGGEAPKYIFQGNKEIVLDIKNC